MQSKLTAGEQKIVNDLYKYRDNRDSIKEIEKEIDTLKRELDQLSKLQYSIEQSMPVGSNEQELYIRMDDNELAIIKWNFIDGPKKSITITKMLEANT